MQRGPYRIPRRTLKEFLLLYRSLRLLWDHNHPEYGVLKSRKEAWSQLAAKLREVHPEITIKMTQQKFHNLRMLYRKHLNSVIQSAQDRDVAQTPTLWYFELLSFLCKKDVPADMALITDATDVDDADDPGEEYLDEEEKADENAGEYLATRTYHSLAGMHLKELLELYREQPVLWDVDRKDYGNRVLRSHSWRVLLAKYQELEPTATMAMVKKKLHNCRTVYRRYLNRVVEFERGVRGQVAVKLWYFELLSFLYDKIVPEDEVSKLQSEEECESLEEDRGDGVAEFEFVKHEIQDFSDIELNEKVTYCSDKSDSELENRTVSPPRSPVGIPNLIRELSRRVDSSFPDVEIKTEESEGETEDHHISPQSLVMPSSSNEVARTMKRRAESLNGEQNIEEQTEVSLERLKMRKLEPEVKDTRDRFDAVGENVAHKLRSLPNRQRIIAEKLINDVLYEAELENLHVHCQLQIPNIAKNL